MSLKEGGLRTIWNRLAAATGIDFAAAGIAIAIIANNQGFENSEDWVAATDNVWAVYVFLLGLMGAFFMWFTGAFVARLRQVEDVSGTSGRLARAVQMAGSVIATVFISSVAVQWAARMLDATEVAALSTALLEGPTLWFAIGVYIGGAGLAVSRAGAGAPSSRLTAYVSLILGPLYIILGGIQVLRNYAWIDETGLFVFFAWVLNVSAAGVQRWATIDSGWTPSRRSAPPSMMRPVAARPVAAPAAVRSSRPAPGPEAGPGPETASPPARPAPQPSAGSQEPGPISEEDSVPGGGSARSGAKGKPKSAKRKGTKPKSGARRKSGPSGGRSKAKAKPKPSGENE